MAKTIIFSQTKTIQACAPTYTVKINKYINKCSATLYFSEASQCMLFLKSLSPKCSIVLFLLLKHSSPKAVCFTALKVLWGLDCQAIQRHNGIHIIFSWRWLLPLSFHCVMKFFPLIFLQQIKNIIRLSGNVFRK